MGNYFRALVRRGPLVVLLLYAFVYGGLGRYYLSPYRTGLAIVSSVMAVLFSLVLIGIAYLCGWRFRSIAASVAFWILALLLAGELAQSAIESTQSEVRGMYFGTPLRFFWEQLHGAIDLPALIIGVWSYLIARRLPPREPPL